MSDLIIKALIEFGFPTAVAIASIAGVIAMYILQRKDDKDKSGRSWEREQKLLGILTEYQKANNEAMISVATNLAKLTKSLEEHMHHEEQVMHKWFIEITEESKRQRQEHSEIGKVLTALSIRLENKAA